MSPAASSTPTPPATLESNNAAAGREAAALVELAQVPSGAQELATALAMGAGVGIGVSVPWLLDRTQFWQVPMDFDATVTWQASHPPSAVDPSGGRSGSGSGPSPSDRLVVFDYAPTKTSPAWSDARLEIEVKSGTPTVTYLRVEGMAGAIDPTPYTDGVTEPRVRVTVDGGCPDSNSKGNGDVNTGSDLTTQMVPTARPTAGLLCEYSGGISPTEPVPNQLRKATPLGANLASKMAAEIAQVPLAHVDGEMRSCPAATGAEAVLALSYADRPDVDVWGTGDGCAWIANGRIATSGLYLAYGVENLVSPSATVAR